MIYIGMEDSMTIDIVFAKAVEKIATDQGKSMPELAHKVLKMTTGEVSIREFRRIMRPDTKGRYRQLPLREAYEFAVLLDKSLDEIVKIGLTL